MKAFILALALALAGCWTGEPQVIVKIVPVAHYIHDEPRTCKGLPAFPGVNTLGHHTFISALSAWVRAAGACLQVDTYKLNYLIEEVSW